MAHLNKSTEIVPEKDLLEDPVYKDNKTLSYKCSDLVHWEDPEGRVEREVGGGIGMGNTCISMADSCQCMTKTTTVL